MNHKIVSAKDWLAARRDFLKAEKELTRHRDEVAQKRLALPWVRVEKEYVFETLDGPRTLADLFDGRSQLLVQHFMFAPGWKEGCPSCSFMADHTEGMNNHLSHHDVTMIAVSRAPLADIERYRKRMCWRFKWVSSSGNDFNYDFHVSFKPDELASGKVAYNYATIDAGIEELPGMSVFAKDADGTVFHTYSSYGRGTEAILTTYALLDMTPKGREETHGLMDWVKRHDEYQTGGKASCCHG